MDQWLVSFILGQMAFFLGLLWIIIHYRSRRQAQRSEERSRMLDRFDDPEALLQFLDSDSGRRYLELAGHRMSSRTALVWVALLGFCGFAFGLVVLLFAFLGLLDGGDGFFVVGGLCLAGGTGILVGTRVALRMLRDES
ncbi:MAG: hypothetical protein AAGE94_15205 [Acidobacteriota bacterium]